MQHPEWRLPGPFRFAREFTTDLAGGRSVVAVVPAIGFPEGLRAAVREAMPDVDTTGFHLGEITEGQGRIVDVLYGRLDLRRPDYDDRVDVQDFVRHPELGRRLIWIDARAGGIRQIETWIDFLERYTAAAKEVPIHDRTVFATLCAGGHGRWVPDSLQLLAKRWWWGVVTPLDTEVRVAEMVRSRPWKPAFVETVTEVAGFDLELAALLAEEWDGAPASISSILRAYEFGGNGTARAWSTRPSPKSEPPLETLEAWSSGAVNAWGYRDPHVHACRATEEGADALQRLIWLGQVRSLMPLIEIERQALAEWVIERRNRLPENWRSKDLRSLEVGDFSAIFRFPGFQKDQQRGSLARWLHRTRNAIAHLDILDKNELEQAKQMLRSGVRLTP